MAHGVLFAEFVQPTAEYAKPTKFVRFAEQLTAFAKQPFGSIRVLFRLSEQRHAGFDLQPAECAWCSRQPVRQPIRSTVRVIQRAIRVCWNAGHARSARNRTRCSRDPRTNSRE